MLTFQSVVEESLAGTRFIERLWGLGPRKALFKNRPDGIHRCVRAMASLIELRVGRWSCGPAAAACPIAQIRPSIDASGSPFKIGRSRSG